MFFSDRIKSISSTDKVLEIGPGSTPHPRSNVLLEKKFSTEEEYQAQTGYNGKLSTDKKLVFYDGDTFPFKDKEFDYVICSHVLEHVDNVEVFLKEVQRVGKKGYFEFPTIYYDYLYNFDVHKTFLLMSNNTILWIPKAESGLNQYIKIQKFFYQSLAKKYYCLVDDLKEYFFQGFEWFDTINYQRVYNFEEVCFESDILSIPYKLKLVENNNTKKAVKLALSSRVKIRVKKLVKRVLHLCL